jgi:hypothetical protein
MNSKCKASLEKALSQRMFLISAKNISENEWNFEVEGYSGTNYKVVFNDVKMTCECPDYYVRKKMCKHIYFIIGRVLKDMTLINDIGGNPNICIFNLKGTLTEDFNRVLNPRLRIEKEKDQENLKGPSGYDDCPI